MDKAPDYYRAGAAAAFTYGLQGTPDDIIPNHHIVAYNAGKGAYNDADLQAIVDIIIAHVAAVSLSIHPQPRTNQSRFWALLAPTFVHK